MSDLISKELFDQIKWERDIAVGQLKELGYGLGEKIRTDKDTIYRQAAIDVIEDTDWYHQNKNKNMVHGANSSEHQAWYKAEDVHMALENVPAAQPDRKVGKWIDHSDDGYVECPFCRSATNCDDNINELHYCFSCGAKMEVEE